MDKWIKLIDELPPRNQQIIVCDSLGEMQIDFVVEVDGQRWWGKNLREDFYNVIYWRELPPLPFQDAIITNDKWIQNLGKINSRR